MHNLAPTEQLRAAMNDLERAYDITLESLNDALDLAHPGSAGESARVTRYTILIARLMTLPANTTQSIARGAFLREIGTLATPRSILYKAGPLTGEERQIVREHCWHGYRLLNKIPFLTEPAEIVLAHHEHYDGMGYPRGLSADRIPLGARISAVAAALNSITSERPYRVAQSIEAAREEISRCSGTQFDPLVVRVFLQIAAGVLRDLQTNSGSV